MRRLSSLLVSHLISVFNVREDRSGAGVAALRGTLTMMENTFVRLTLVGRLALISLRSRAGRGSSRESKGENSQPGCKLASVWVRVLPRGCQKVDYLGNDFLTVADLLQVNGLLITGLRVCMC